MPKIQRRVKKKPRKYIRATQAQLQTLKRVKMILSEKGYRIFPLAKAFRRHYSDFLAIGSSNRTQMLLVRPSWNGVIEVRHSVQKSHYSIVLSKIKKSASALKLRWGRQLPFGKNEDTWQRFIQKKYWLELGLFTNRTKLKHAPFVSLAGPLLAVQRKMK